MNQKQRISYFRLVFIFSIQSNSQKLFDMCAALYIKICAFSLSNQDFQQNQKYVLMEKLFENPPTKKWPNTLTAIRISQRSGEKWMEMLWIRFEGINGDYDVYTEIIIDCNTFVSSDCWFYHWSNLSVVFCFTGIGYNKGCKILMAVFYFFYNVLCCHWYFPSYIVIRF